jgi:hypothetical protein
MPDRLNDSVYEELSDSLARAKRQSSTVLTGSQNAHHVALESLLAEFRRDYAAEVESSKLLAGRHPRKQDQLARQAVDDFHSQLVACD